MSISSALSNALSGLSVSSRTAEVISDNVANAMTEGYAARDARLSARAVGGRGAGAAVDAVVARADPRATAERRAAETALGESSALDGAQARLAAIFGAPDEAGSLASRAVALEAALDALADAPESATLQSGALAAAKGVAGAMNVASEAVQALREDADAATSRLVSDLSAALEGVDRLNRDIVARSGSREVAALVESRDRLIDRISDIVPVRVAQRSNGEIALYSPGGAVLLDGKPAALGFAPAGQITADMTVASGALSQVTLNGRPLDLGTGQGRLDGGALGAQLAIRDGLGPEASAQLDALALDLIERFADPTLDLTLPPGAPGLFTDAGAYPDPLLLDGLAGRISVNGAADPALGGELRRLRDGMGSAVAGPAGEDDLLRGMLDAMRAPAPAPTATGASGALGFSDLTAGAASRRLGQAAEAEGALAFREGRHSTLAEAESAAIGVNTDDELAKLLLVEKAYAANARLISTMDALLRQLLEI